MVGAKDARETIGSRVVAKPVAGGLLKGWRCLLLEQNFNLRSSGMRRRNCEELDRFPEGRCPARHVWGLSKWGLYDKACCHFQANPDVLWRGHHLSRHLKIPACLNMLSGS